MGLYWSTYELTPKLNLLWFINKFAEVIESPHPNRSISLDNGLRRRKVIININGSSIFNAI